MPPYKPLPVPFDEGKILPPEWFSEPDVSLDDVLVKEALMRAQNTSNQQNALRLQESQRALEEDEQLRSALRDSYANSPTPPTEEEVLNSLSRSAAKIGDYKTLLDLERAKKTAKLESDKYSPLSPEIRAVIESQMGTSLPENVSYADIDRINQAGRSRAYMDSTQALISGTRIRPMAAEDARTISGTSVTELTVDDLKTRYLPEISRNRGERFLAAAANPNSAAARLNRELDLLSTQLAQAFNGSRLSDRDVQTMQDLLKPNPLDTYETVISRLDRLKDFTSRQRETLLTNLGKANFNVSGFRQEAPPMEVNAPDPIATAQRLAAEPPKEESKEEFIQRRIREKLGSSLQEAQ